MSDQTDNQLDELTAEEREALAYVEPTEDSADVNQSEQQTEQTDPDAAPAETGSADPAGADAAAGAGDAEQAAAANADPAPAAAPSVEAAAEPQAAPASAPILIAQAPADADAQLADIATSKDKILDQYEAGELTAKEMQKQIDALNDKAFEIKQAVRDAELAQKMEAQRQQNEWDRDCRSFLDANKADYHGEDKAERLQALDSAIKVMAAMPVHRGISGPALLAKAHAFVKASYGEAVTTAAPAPAATKLAQAPVPKPTIPPTNIGKLPAADANDTTGGEFAALDALAKGGNVEAYENALAALGESQRARYMSR